MAGFAGAFTARLPASVASLSSIAAATTAAASTTGSAFAAGPLVPGTVGWTRFRSVGISIHHGQSVFNFVLGKTLIARRGPFVARLRVLGCGRLTLRGPVGGHNFRHVLVVVFQIKKVGDVEERIALQADIHEGRLHAGKDAGNPALIDGSGEGVLVFALEVDFGELIVFHQPNFGLVRRGRNK